MDDSTATVASLKGEVKAFCEERDWDRFHNPKDLAIGMVTEASELLDIFRFKDAGQCQALLSDPGSREHIEEEVADVLYFVLRFAQMNGIDLSEALESKISKNAKKYPVDLSKGKNLKYTEFGD
ncbi:MAG: nucleotide pyrophosphohydrolase [Candidatus Methanomethylophilaceae archaeon]|jgi:NTP pyrophosphatase (non-canonical NTP hydrolase)|nr:nucleotide pyrophosphohydrolase [Candidatus Methanomethylophilaceae archaeon]